MDLSNPKIFPWHPPPNTSENLFIDKLQDIHKVAIEEQNNCFPAIHKHNL